MSEVKDKAQNLAGDALGGLSDAASGAVNVLTDAAGGVVDMAKDVASSDLGKAAILGGAAYMGADAAGLLGETSATGATTAAVTTGSVLETPLGTLDAAEAAAGTGAVSSAVSSGSVTETGLGPLPESTSTIAGGAAAGSILGNMTATDALLGGVLLDKGLGGLPKVITNLTGGGGGGDSTGGGSTTTTKTDKAVDYTANERRASQSEIDDAMAFQLDASKRLRGANILANGGKASIGTKKLLGA